MGKIMEIVCFEQKYEEKVVQFWNETMVHDQIDIEIFRKQILFDENFRSELCLLMMDGTEPAGFLLGMKRKIPYLDRGLEPERGWINVMFVGKQYQRQGIGTALVKRAEETLKSLGAKSITLAAYSPNYFFPGIDVNGYKDAVHFFEALGYQKGEPAFSMEKNLQDFSIAPEWKEKLRKAEKDGFEFRDFQWKDSLELLEFLGKNFGGGWKRNALRAMQAGNAEDVITVVLHQEKIVGFAMRQIDGNPMRFGPIGVCEAVRNAGIGGILFEIKQQEMHSKGISRLFFLSTDIPGRRFYERHGVRVFREYRKYAKVLEDSTR